MNKIVNVGLIFKNRVGIVSQVSKKIFENLQVYFILRISVKRWWWRMLNEQ